jgi:hypothetical protein
VDLPLPYYRRHDTNRTANEERALLGFIHAHSRNLDRARTVLDPAALATIRQRVAENSFILGYHYVRTHRFSRGRRRYVASIRGVGLRRVAAAYLKFWVLQARHVLGLAPVHPG